MLLNATLVAKLSLIFLAATAGASRTDAPQSWRKLAERLNGAKKNDTDAVRALKEVNEGFKDHSVEFFKNLDANGASFLFTKTVSASIEEYAGGDKGFPKHFSKFAEHISIKDLENMHPDVCGIFMNGLEYIKASKAPVECRKKYYEMVLKGEVRLSTIKGIPAAWVSDNGKDIISSITMLSTMKATTLFNLLNDATFKALFGENEGENEFCSSFHAKFLDGLTEGQRKMISSSCMAQIPAIGKTDLIKFNGYSEKIFSLYNGNLTSATIGKLSGKQLSHFASKVDDEEKRCGELSLRYLTTSAIKSIPSKCLYGFLKSSKGKVAIGKQLTHVPSSVFKEWTEDQREVFGDMHPDDFMYLSTESVQLLIDSKAAVEALPKMDDEKLTIFKDDALKTIKVTAETFNRLAEKAPIMAGQVFTACKQLPNDVLTMLEPETIKSLTGKKGINAVSGFEFLDSNRTKLNFSEIIKVMGDKANTHVCSTIGLDSYVEMGWLRPHAGSECKKALPFANDLAALKRTPEVAKEVDDIWKTALDSYKEADWRAINSGLMAVFAKKKEFCQALGSEHKSILKLLKSSALSSIGPECAILLVNAIDSTLAPKLAVDAFALFKGSDMKVSLKDLTVAQIPFVSARLAEAGREEHVFSKISPEALKELDDARFAAISSEQWGLVVPSTFNLSLTSERIKLIRPSNLARISDQQLAALSEELLLAFTAEQISEMGKEVENELKAFEKLESKLDQPRINAIKANKEALVAAREAKAKLEREKANTKDDGASSNIIWWIIGGGIVVGIIGAVIFIIVRRN